MTKMTEKEMYEVIKGVVAGSELTADMVMEEISEEDIVKFVINIYKVRNRLSALVRDGMIYKSAHTVNKKVAYTFKPEEEEKAETETESKEE